MWVCVSILLLVCRVNKQICQRIACFVWRRSIKLQSKNTFHWSTAISHVRGVVGSLECRYIFKRYHPLISEVILDLWINFFICVGILLAIVMGLPLTGVIERALCKARGGDLFLMYIELNAWLNNKSIWMDLCEIVICQQFASQATTVFDDTSLSAKTSQFANEPVWTSFC